MITGGGSGATFAGIESIPKVLHATCGAIKSTPKAEMVKVNPKVEVNQFH